MSPLGSDIMGKLNPHLVNATVTRMTSSIFKADQMTFRDGSVQPQLEAESFQERMTFCIAIIRILFLSCISYTFFSFVVLEYGLVHVLYTQAAPCI
jgi:hypothetical protein